VVLKNVESDRVGGTIAQAEQISVEIHYLVHHLSAIEKHVASQFVARS
jgi:hypothetical protein